MKKRTPVAVWEVIQPLITEYRLYFVPLSTKDLSFHLKDADPNSSFEFKCGIPNRNGDVLISVSPTSDSNNATYDLTTKITDIAPRLKQWVQLLARYEKVMTFYEDPIEKSYEEKFAVYFQLQEEDADTTPYDLYRQLWLDAYLTDVIALLEEHKETASEQQKLELNILEGACRQLKEEITLLTKTQTVKRLVKILAKAQKYGLSLLKGFLEKLKEEGTSLLVKKLLEGEVSSLESILKLLS